MISGMTKQRGTTAETATFSPELNVAQQPKRVNFSSVIPYKEPIERTPSAPKIDSFLQRKIEMVSSATT